MSNDAFTDLLKIKDQNDKEISRLKDVIGHLVCGHSPVIIHSDYWVKRLPDGTYEEMSVEEQLEVSK